MINESLRDVLRGQLLEQPFYNIPLPDWAKDIKNESVKKWIMWIMREDALVKNYYLAKTEKEAKKALDTYKSIRAGSVHIPKVISVRKMVMSGKVK